MFESFAGSVDPEVQERLATWLPDVLNGGKKELNRAAKGLSEQEAADLEALAEAHDLKADFVGKNDHDGPFGKLAEKALEKRNGDGLQQLQRSYGDHALKASTPGLVPGVSYDSHPTLDATRQALYDTFVSGLGAADREQLAGWLPDVLFGDESAEKAAKALSDKEEDALEALAKEHGIKSKSSIFSDGGDYGRLKGLETAFERDLALETTGRLPSVVDMMLVHKYGERDDGDVAINLDLDGDDILEKARSLEKQFGELDSWLPAVLAGRAGMPTDDEAAMACLVAFADELGFDPKTGGSLQERAENALDYVEKQDLIAKTLHPGKTSEDRAFLLFTDRFLESTLAYGARNGALDQGQLLDAANVAEMLLGPDDGTDAPRELQMAGLQAAILHRTDKPLARPQEVMAASGYINQAETLTEQKARLAESLLAFHVREEIGTAPMSPLQWAESYADLHPEMLDDLGSRAFNAPTGERLQIITQHLGVPGDHEFMIDKKREIEMKVDDQGHLDYFDRDKKGGGLFGKVLDIVAPVLGTALTFVPGAQPLGLAINAGYSAYKSMQAIRHGDELGGLLGFASAIPGTNVVTRGAQLAQGALRTVRAIEDKDLLGALSGGLGTFRLAGGGQQFQTAATGVDTAGALKDGDFLEAGAGLTQVASDLSRPADGRPPHNDTSLALNTLSSGLDVADGIQEDNYAQIGSGLAGGIRGVGEQMDHERRLALTEELARRAAPHSPQQPPEGDGSTPVAGGAGPVIRQAGYTDPNGPPAAQAIEIAPGDTLSQIAARHGTTVEALMAANPGIADPNRVHAGQQLDLPDGVQPVERERQVRLAQFEKMNGGPSHLPSLPRPEQGDPMLQPGATHPNAGGHAAGKPLSEFQGNVAMADSELELGMRLYRQDAEVKLSELDREIADIERQIEQSNGDLDAANLRHRSQRKALIAERAELEATISTPEATMKALRQGSNTYRLRPEILEKVVNGRELLLGEIEESRAELTRTDLTNTVDLHNEVLNLNDAFLKMGDLGHAYQTLVDQEAKLNEGKTIYVPKDIPKSWGEFIAQEAAAAAAGGTAGFLVKGSKYVKNAVDAITSTITSQSLKSDRENLQGEITIKLRDNGIYEVKVPETYDGNVTWASKVSHYELRQNGRVFHKEDDYFGGNLGQHPQKIKINKYVDGLDLRSLTNGGADFSNGQVRILPDVRHIINSLLSSGR